MSAPARSRTSLNSTAPSPIASTRGPIAAISSPSATGEHARADNSVGGPCWRPSGQPAANTSPRRASSTARTEPSRTPSSADALQATDCSVETPTSGISRARASARALATPIRKPVNVPGPTPTAIASTSSHPTPPRFITSATSSSTRVACLGRSPGAGSSRASSSSGESPLRNSAATVARVAVSKATIVTPAPPRLRARSAHCAGRRRHAPSRP